MNKDTIILPLEKSFTVTFAPNANAVGILLNNPNTYPWLMNCFIQLTCWGDKYIDYYDFNYRECPILFCQRIKKEIIDTMEGGMLSFIVKALEKHYYVMIPVETKYIEEYDIETIHEMLIYGHADSNIFYIADNFKRGKYGTGICSADEIIRATDQINLSEYWRNGFDGTLELLSYRKQDRAKFELHRVIESIQDYLSSVATREWYVHRAMWDEDETKNRCYGMQCYHSIFSHIQMARERGYFEDSGHRALFLEWEHKKIMVMRLKWMQTNYLISEEIIRDYCQLEEQARIAMLLKLKFDITKTRKLCNRIEDIYQMMKEKEKDILLQLLYNLLNR